MPITEEELQKRLAESKASLKIAGPDDPIYSTGLSMISIRKLKMSTLTSPDDTDGDLLPPGVFSSKGLERQKRLDQFYKNLEEEVRQQFGPTEASSSPTGRTVMPITEKELQRRRAAYNASYTVAGPDDPIYSSGLSMTSVRKLKPPTTTSSPDTGGTNPEQAVLLPGGLSFQEALDILNEALLPPQPGPIDESTPPVDEW